MMDNVERDKKRLYVMLQLEREINAICNETHEEYVLYKECDRKANPQKFINELVNMGLRNKKIFQDLTLLENYYHCDKELAVLLYLLTDAIDIMKK